MLYAELVRYSTVSIVTALFIKLVRRPSPHLNIIQFSVFNFACFFDHTSAFVWYFFFFFFSNWKELDACSSAQTPSADKICV